jgi:hypothetical protein
LWNKTKRRRNLIPNTSRCINISLCLRRFFLPLCKLVYGYNCIIVNAVAFIEINIKNVLLWEE